MGGYPLRNNTFWANQSIGKIRGKNDIRAPNNSGEVHSLGKSAIKKGSIFSKGIPFKPDNLRDRKRKLSYI